MISVLVQLWSWVIQYVFTVFSCVYIYIHLWLHHFFPLVTPPALIHTLSLLILPLPSPSTVSFAHLCQCFRIRLFKHRGQSTLLSWQLPFTKVIHLCIIQAYVLLVKRYDCWGWRSPCMIIPVIYQWANLQVGALILLWINVSNSFWSSFVTMIKPNTSRRRGGCLL